LTDKIADFVAQWIGFGEAGSENDEGFDDLGAQRIRLADGGGKGDGTSDGKGKGGGKGGSAHRKLNVPPADTCVLSAAEVVALRETYDFVSVTGCASENDVHAVVHAITKAGRAEYNAAAASNSATVSAASATTPASRAR